MTDRSDSKNPAPNPYVFVVGCPRSGTTLLRRLLDAHPGLCIPKAETHWIPKFYLKRKGLTDDGRVTAAFVDMLLNYPRFAKFDVSREELVGLLGGQVTVEYPEFVRRLFDLYGARRGKRRVGDKTPGYARHIKLLHQLFPNSRFIHLVRDGRDVALSLRSWSRRGKSVGRLVGYASDSATTTALYWEWMVRLAREAGEALPPGFYLEVRYEELVAATPGECRRMCGFLGLDYDARMLDYHAGRQRADASLSAKKAWLPPTRKLRDWRTEMDREDLLRFEAASGDLLSELGYSRAIDPVPVAARRHAEDLRGEFERHPHPVAWRAKRA